MVKFISREAYFWILQRLCAMYRAPVPDEPAQRLAASFHSPESLLHSARLFGFDTASRNCKAERLRKELFPLIAWQKGQGEQSRQTVQPALREVLRPVLLLQADQRNVVILAPGDAVPNTVPLAEFARRFTGAITSVKLHETRQQAMVTLPARPAAAANVPAARPACHA
jgi:subfamily B ATP-binding cassette protein HlyB/CyaB